MRPHAQNLNAPAGENQKKKTGIVLKGKRRSTFSISTLT